MTKPFVLDVQSVDNAAPASQGVTEIEYTIVIARESDTPRYVAKPSFPVSLTGGKDQGGARSPLRCNARRERRDNGQDPREERDRPGSPPAYPCSSPARRLVVPSSSLPRGPAAAARSDAPSPRSSQGRSNRRCECWRYGRRRQLGRRLALLVVASAFPVPVLS